ncbi:putative DNA binding domain-containing protein [candidate division WOR-3 bacterium]|nr:putative DNA binding domain-containing protein [candidate division WOR-3 bacterium]
MTAEQLNELLLTEEDEHLEFKKAEHDFNIEKLRKYCCALANERGGKLILGVTNRKPRRVVGTEAFRDLEHRRSDLTQILHLRIDAVEVQHPHGRVVVFDVPSRPIGVPLRYDGVYWMRSGDSLTPMTEDRLKSIFEETGLEMTATPVDGNAVELVSAAGMEELRKLMEEAGAVPDLLRQGDIDLLRALGGVSGDGRLLVAGLLLAGKPEAIRKSIPCAQWQFRRMRSDTEYDQANDGYDSIPVALRRLRELVGANNPIVTIPGWLVHPEFPRYPMLALRELIVNALAHRDYRAPGAITLKLYPDRLELSNPGGFVGGVTPDNILHHPSVPRNPALFGALTRIRLANASNLGVPRVYRDLLSEGKEPPVYWASGQAVRVTVKGQEARREFLQLVKENAGLDIDDLLVLHYLTRHREVTVHTAAAICQRPAEVVRETLGQLVTQWRLLEPCGAGKGRYYRLSLSAYNVLLDALSYHLDGRVTKETARARVLKALRAGPLTNAQVRELTGVDRNHAWALMHELVEQGYVEPPGRGRGSRWLLRPGAKNAD